ncbi:MAG TPA: hypothetical protein PKY19_05125 [Oscillospiraceae bacterium]|nr:hypothetical protein [Oscillospiraceae bacterium]HXK77846.1 hypothetical protein [Oscillospiraceae bacterium]
MKAKPMGADPASDRPSKSPAEKARRIKLITATIWFAAGAMFAAAGVIGGFPIYYSIAALDTLLGCLYLRQYRTLQKQNDEKKE